MNLFDYLIKNQTVNVVLKGRTEREDLLMGVSI
jgi:hypothetical protein